jgi:hypothetical protein
MPGDGSPIDLSRLPRDELEGLIERLLIEVAELKETVAGQRDEIARLKGLQGRPSIKPSGMEGSGGSRSVRGGKSRPRRKGSKRLTLDEDRLVAAVVPTGSRFKGYEDYVVQDLVVRRHVIRFRRERWLRPDGTTVVAPLPEGVVGHYGAALRRFVLAQYHRGQVTVPRLVAQLDDFGIVISKRQVMRLLTDPGAGFLGEAGDVLRAGLETARWITVDDTGARHAGANAVCTQIGDDRFTFFATTGSNSRVNFLGLLRAGHGDYVINDAALAYMRRHNLVASDIAKLARHRSRRFGDEAAWRAHLKRRGIGASRGLTAAARIATEGALWGSITDHGLLAGAVIISDGAAQFNVGHHARCWVHAERLIHSLIGFSEAQRAALDRIRARVWWFYADLKTYGRDPTAAAKRALDRRFDRIFTARTAFVTLDRLLARLHADKDDLLVALERPDIPLHTNGSENDIRCQVTRRKISAGTRSEAGRDCRDGFLGLMKTCDKLGIGFWDYLGSRLMVPDAPLIPPLPDLIRQRAAA